MAGTAWLWGSLLVVSLALVAFTLAVTTLLLASRTVLRRRQRTQERRTWKLFGSSFNGHVPEDSGRWPPDGDPER
jgi:hypothetical protein